MSEHLKIYLEEFLTAAEETDPNVKVEFIELYDNDLSIVTARKVNDKIVAKCSHYIDKDQFDDKTPDEIKTIARACFENTLRGVEMVEMGIIKGECKMSFN